MKYFVKMTRPIKFDAFQFSKGITYEISAELAMEFYHEWCGRQGEATYEGEAQVLYENGTTIQVHKHALMIYGMAWDDKELFTRRLKGDIAGEIWK